MRIYLSLSHLVTLQQLTRLACVTGLKAQGLESRRLRHVKSRHITDEEYEPLKMPFLSEPQLLDRDNPWFEHSCPRNCLCPGNPRQLSLIKMQEDVTKIYIVTPGTSSFFGKSLVFKKYQPSLWSMNFQWTREEAVLSKDRSAAYQRQHEEGEISLKRNVGKSRFSGASVIIAHFAILPKTRKAD